MKTLVLLRHGESIWNMENRFTGWTDVGLSDKGIQEAREAGRLLREGGYVFDMAYTSVLKGRSKLFGWRLKKWIQCGFRLRNPGVLNERHYGALQGLNKQETVDRHGEQQVKIWRRSYDIRPPLSTRATSVAGQRSPLRFVEAAGDPVDGVSERHRRSCAALLAKYDRSGRDQRQTRADRFTWKQLAGIDQISGQDLRRRHCRSEHSDRFPLVYELNDDLTPIRSFYLGDADAVARATQAVADQTKKK